MREMTRSSLQTEGQTAQVTLAWGPDQPGGSGWRRYSLRTLLIAITVAACLSGWIRHQIREREALLALVISRGGSTSITFQGRKPAPRRIAWLTPAAWFEPVSTIIIEAGELTPAEVERVRRAFPEAELVEYTPHIHVLPTSIPPVGVNS